MGPARRNPRRRAHILIYKYNYTKLNPNRGYKRKRIYKRGLPTVFSLQVGGGRQRRAAGGGGCIDFILTYSTRCPLIPLMCEGERGDCDGDINSGDREELPRIRPGTTDFDVPIAPESRPSRRKIPL